MIQKEKSDGKTGEGLAGHKGFRCLSCNRVMDGMRPKPNPMNFTSFVSHLPAPKNRLYPRRFLTGTLEYVLPNLEAYEIIVQ